MICRISETLEAEINNSEIKRITLKGATGLFEIIMYGITNPNTVNKNTIIVGIILYIPFFSLLSLTLLFK
ncbi:MAG: hypothetical protein GQ469_02440 [Methanosarcinales archaeon]|nr:hypothetical protein [Methanosarcinales archaeon]